MAKLAQLVEKQLLQYVQDTGRIPVQVINVKANSVTANIRLYHDGE